MKASRLLLCCLWAMFVSAPVLSAQEPPKRHRVVVEITAGEAEQWTHALDGVENLRRALGPENTEVEVVAHARGILLLAARDNPLAERLRKMADEGVVFAACQNSMRSFHLDSADLLPVARQVDAGVAEVVRKQEAGWPFLKYGN